MKPKNLSLGVLLLSAILFVIASLHIYRAHIDNRYRYNWDVLAYAAVAQKMAGVARADLHASTYTHADVIIPAENYRALVEGQSGSTYRQRMATSPEAFLKQLPYYKIKLAYPALMSALICFGLNPIAATAYVSMFAYIGLTVVLLKWLAGFLPWLVAFSLGAAIITQPLLLAQSYVPTPDTLSALCVLSAFALLAHRTMRWALLIGVGSLLVRPDNIIPLAAFAGIATILGHWRFAAAALAVGAAIFLALVNWPGTYPWATLFYHSFVASISDPVGFVSPLAIRDYLAIYGWFVMNAPMNNPALPTMLVIGLLTLVLRVRRRGWRDIYTLIVVAALACILGHWVIFPSGAPRHLYGYYIVILVSLAKNFADTFAMKRSSNPPMRGPAAH